MQNPIREQVRLDGRWQARRVDAESVSLFVPGSWTEKNVILKPGENAATAQAELNGQPLVPAEAESGWQTEPHLQAGQWNTVRLSGQLEGARLIAREALHITALDASGTSQRSLVIRIRLSGTVTDPCLLSLDFTLTAADGRRVGAMSVVVGNKNRDLSLEMPLEAPCTGPHRLKATLSCGDRVTDNARIDIQL